MKKSTILRILSAYIASFALLNIGHIGTTSIITLVIFILCYISLHWMDTIITQQGSAKGKRPALILSLLFSTLYLLAEHTSLTGGLTNRLFCFVYLLLTFSGLAVLSYQLILCLFALTKSFTIFGGSSTLSDKKTIRRTFFLYAVIILLCQLPYFLYQYPGVMTPDSINQYKQIIGVLPYSNHHPWVHTMFIRFCLSLGTLFSENVTVGIALYTVLQMCIMASIESFFIVTVQKQGLKKGFCIALLCFFGLIPYNALFAVTMWKDVLFAGSLLLYTTVLYRFMITLRNKEALLSRKSDLVLFVLSAVFVCLLRSNGWYAFLLMTPLCLWYFRTHWKLIGTLHLLVFAVVLTVKGPILNAYGVAPGEFTESLSVPIQQVASVIANGRAVTEEQMASLEKICDASQIAVQYNPSLSDPMKNLLYAHGTEYFDTHKSEYFNLWLQLGMAYPMDYIEAYVNQTKGYWFGMNPIGLSNEGIITNDLGLTWQPIIRGSVVIKLYELVSKLYTIFPLLGMLWSMGGLLWLTLISLGNCSVNGKKQNLILYALALAVMLSVMAATPVADEFRYAYAFILTAPLLFIAGLEHAIPEADATAITQAESSLP